MSAGRRVLIITGAYAPAMSAEMHRARHLAWELPAHGWTVEIMAPGAALQPPLFVDTDSDGFFGGGPSVHTVDRPNAALRFLGVRGVGWLALLRMLQLARQRLRQQRFDLVFLSTTQLPLFLLGPLLRKLFGVPYVLDFHDPPKKDGANFPVWDRPRWRHRVAFAIFRQIERWSVPRAAGLISVSPDYLDALRSRYGERQPHWLRPERNAVIPFAVLPQDFAQVFSSSMPKAQTDVRRIVYVGAGGPIMRKSFAVICRALARLRLSQPHLCANIRVELFGTMLYWREGDARDLQAIAAEHGITDLVEEKPRRISYRRSLEEVAGSDGVFVLGVDDAGYMPSKLFGYAYSGKPLLASLRRDGPAYATLASNPRLGHVVWFAQDDEMPAAEADAAVASFLEEVAGRRNIDRTNALEPYTATTMARRHAELFEACLH